MKGRLVLPDKSNKGLVSVTLDDCPFCDGLPMIARYNSPVNQMVLYSAFCQGCGCTQRACQNQLEAATGWNKRKSIE